MPEKQQSIYESVIKSIRKKGYSVGRVSTLDNWEKGVFIWAHLNKLTGSLASNRTKGIIETDGVSTQIIFDAGMKKIPETHRIKWNNKVHYILSKNLLGYGVNSIRYALTQAGWQYRCYPEGYKNYPGFDIYQCGDAYSRLMDLDKTTKDNVRKISHLNVFKSMSFIGLGAVYFDLSIFGNQNLIAGALREKVSLICNNMRSVYQNLKTKPSSEQYDAENKCINGVFLYNLIFNELKIRDGKINITEDVDGNEISWTAGFLMISEQNRKFLSEGH